MVGYFFFIKMSVKCTLLDNNTYFQQPGRTSLDKLKAILGFFYTFFSLNLNWIYQCYMRYIFLFNFYVLTLLSTAYILNSHLIKRKLCNFIITWRWSCYKKNYKDTSLHLILVLNENITICREKILLIDFNFYA